MKKQNEISLYIHIPFCVRKCNYCDFLSAPADEQTMEAYIQALLLEIKAYEGSELTQRQVKSIFIGGGTPSILAPVLLQRVLRQIKTTFNISEKAYEQAEITMEMNPGTVDFEKCRAYYQMGINRISIGLQSTCDRELQILGRIHTFDDFMSTYKNVRKAGFQNVNVDLMSALPGQTLESYKEGLEQVLELGPEHISAYSLIIEEGTPFFEWYENKDANLLENMTLEAGKTTELLPLPDEDVERKMYEITDEILSRYGYERYEISNYAQKGHACQHNITYWQRGDYLGFGIGSASLVNEHRFSNIDSLTEYIKYQTEFNLKKNMECPEIVAKNSSFVTEEAFIESCKRKELCKLELQEQMEEFMFLGMRMICGVSKRRFQKNFGKTMEEVYGEIIDQFVSQGLLKWEKKEDGDDYLSLSPKGIDVSNVIFAQFLL